MEEDFKGFRVTKELYNNVIVLKFTFGSAFTDKEFSQFLAILDKFLTDKNKFVLYIDTKLCRAVHMRYGLTLTNWMKRKKPDIPGILLGSSVIASSQLVISLINQAFKIQKPTSPNMMTKDPEKGKKFLEGVIDKTISS